MTTTKQDAYQKPVFSEELFQSYYPMIVDIIMKQMSIMKPDSQNLDDFDDIFSRCRYWFYEYCDKYDPSRVGKNGRPQKFSTFINMVLRSRVGSIRVNNHLKTKVNTCIDWSSYQEFYLDINGEDTETDISSVVDSDYLIDIDPIDFKMNLQKIQDILDKEQYEMYCDLFINGYKPKEIAKKFLIPKYNEKKIFNELKELHFKIFGVEA